MKVLVFALCFMPTFVLADAPDPKALALTNAYVSEMIELEKKYMVAVERLKAVLIAEERKRREETIAKLQALQGRAAKEQSLELAISAKSEAEKLKSLSYSAEVKTVPNKPFKLLAITKDFIGGAHGRVFFTPALIDEKAVEWANKRIYLDTDGAIYLSSGIRFTGIGGETKLVEDIPGSWTSRNARTAALEQIDPLRDIDENNKIGFWRVSKKGELEFFDTEKKHIGFFWIAYSPIGLFGFGAANDINGSGRHLLHIEQ